MRRSDPGHNAHRCKRCTLPPRWCICEGLAPLDAGVDVDVLMHEREALRPTSTGHLISRIVSGARTHLWDSGRTPPLELVQRPDRELWVLHPQGELMPEPGAGRGVQVLLIDGSWKQSAAMMKTVRGWGRRVRLDLKGESRYWLRAQSAEGRFSTIEALLGFLDCFGRGQEAAALRRMFELHVYAVLCARGEKVQAAAYLEHSPIATAFPELVARLNHCRRDYFY